MLDGARNADRTPIIASVIDAPADTCPRIVIPSMPCRPLSAIARASVVAITSPTPVRLQRRKRGRQRWVAAWSRLCRSGRQVGRGVPLPRWYRDGGLDVADAAGAHRLGASHVQNYTTMTAAKLIVIPYRSDKGFFERLGVPAAAQRGSL